MPVLFIAWDNAAVSAAETFSLSHPELISLCMATLFEKVQKLGLLVKDWEIVMLLYIDDMIINSGLGKSNRTLI